MARKQTKGFCKYCGKEYAKAGMLRHLASCKERKVKTETPVGKRKDGYFELVITGKYDKDYWLIVEMKDTATLEDLDIFIRDIWVECCGHLSGFNIDGVQYESHPATNSFWGPPAKSMNCKLGKVLEVGQTITYEYDYGSTTSLLITVHGYREGAGGREKVTILSRNNPPEILCNQCGKNQAQWVNPEGFYDGNPYWCEECAKESFLGGAELEEGYSKEDYLEDFYPGEYLMPVCNSPRMGVCGYDGSSKYPDQFQPDKGAE